MIFHLLVCLEEIKILQIYVKITNHTAASRIFVFHCFNANSDGPSEVPDELISPNELRRISVPIYGMKCWGDLFSPRQLLALTTLTRCVRRVRNVLGESESQSGLADAVQVCLGLAIGRLADRCSALCTWDPSPAASGILHMFARQAISMVWDYAEGAPMEEKSGGWSPTLAWITRVLEQEGKTTNWGAGSVQQTSATKHPLPDDAADAFITDPPYYDAVPYAYLSDFFYVWLRRTLAETHPSLFRDACVPKEAEIVVDRAHQLSQSNKGIAFYESELQKAFAESRRVLRPDGIGTIVFASKTTSSWEAILKAVVDAGWVITGSWPIDTEMENRVSAIGQARLASSVHLVCRPREDASGAVTEAVGKGGTIDALTKACDKADAVVSCGQLDAYSAWANAPKLGSLAIVMDLPALLIVLVIKK